MPDSSPPPSPSPATTSEVETCGRRIVRGGIFRGVCAEPFGHDSPNQSRAWPCKPAPVAPPASDAPAPPREKPLICVQCTRMRVASDGKACALCGGSEFTEYNDPLAASPAQEATPGSPLGDSPWLRRIRRDQQTPAERAITDAMYAVERAGAHLLLTDAVNLLGQAREKVADFVDGVASAAPPNTSNQEPNHA